MRIPLLALTLALAAGCGGESHESLAKQSVEITEELLTILEGVTDRASAEAVEDELKSLAARSNGIQQRVARLPRLKPEDEQALRAKYSDRMKRIRERQAVVMKRLLDQPEIYQTLSPVLRTMR